MRWEDMMWEQHPIAMGIWCYGVGGVVVIWWFVCLVRLVRLLCGKIDE